MNAAAEFTHRIAPLLWSVTWQVTLLVALVGLVALLSRRASANWSATTSPWRSSKAAAPTIAAAF